jgi:hypothetical protein
VHGHEYRGNAASVKCSGNRRRRLGGGERGGTGEKGLYNIYHTNERTPAKEEGDSNVARPPAVTLASGDFTVLRKTPLSLSISAKATKILLFLKQKESEVALGCCS